MLGYGLCFLFVLCVRYNNNNNYINSYSATIIILDNVAIPTQKLHNNATTALIQDSA